ncbi:MAG TPA: hypothetical protein VH814_16020 [Steroidobacteraceae bacterium]|jgi:hypothetical protein
MHSSPDDPPQKKPAYSEHHSVGGAKTDAPAQAPATDAHDMLNRMAKDLAQRLGTPLSSIAVLSIQQVVWDDSSLGCAQPGRSYLPAQTPGVRVVFAHDNQPYQYHGSDSGNFVYCEHPAVSGLDEK